MVAACAPPTQVAVEKPAAVEKEVVEKELSKEITEYARDGDIEGVRSLIDQGADPNTQDKKGMTALLYAARGGHTEVAELLISKGADLTVAEPGAHLTALHFCALRGHHDIAEALIAKGADMDAEDKTGNNPLHLAAHSGHGDVAELLIMGGADVDRRSTGRNTEGRTPLHVASQAGHADVAELLISKGADVNARGGDNETPLHLAAYGNHKGVAKLLISNGADINPVGGDGYGPSSGTPLDAAIWMDSGDAAELLRQHGGQRAPTPAPP